MQQVIKGIGISLEDKLNEGIKVLKENVQEGKPYYGGFSGGKDSTVLKEICKMAEVDVEWHYNVTTIDPPELIRFIKDFHKDVIFEMSKKGGFFKRIPINGFPTRLQRWCCKELKEADSPNGQNLVLGLRGDESPRRKKAWELVTPHKNKNCLVISPIFNLTDDEVWYFIRSRGIPYCSLYDEGFKRLGCIGCPMVSKKLREEQFQRWPKYEKAWKSSFKVLWNKKSGSFTRDGRKWFGDRYFETSEELWEWYKTNKSIPKDEI